MVEAAPEAVSSYLVDFTRHPEWSRNLEKVWQDSDDSRAAARWYAQALGATELWNLGGVVGLTVQGASFFLGEPANNGWDTPSALGSRTVRVEVFVDNPDSFIQRAVAAGADGSVDEIRDHQTPWGVHRQGGFIDPFGHLWLVGDRSPLSAHEIR